MKQNKTRWPFRLIAFLLAVYFLGLGSIFIYGIGFTDAALLWAVAFLIGAFFVGAGFRGEVPKWLHRLNPSFWAYDKDMVKTKEKVNIINIIAIGLIFFNLLKFKGRYYEVVYTFSHLGQLFEMYGLSLMIFSLLYNYVFVIVSLLGAVGLLLKKHWSLVVVKWCLIIELILRCWGIAIGWLDYFYFSSLPSYLGGQGEVVIKMNPYPIYFEAILIGMALYIITRPRIKNELVK